MAATATKAEIQAQLELEAVERPKGAVAALASAVFAVGGAAYAAFGLGNQPNASMLGSLTNVEKPGQIGTLPSQRVPLFEYYSSHKAGLIIAAIFALLAYAFAGYALLVLQKAVRHRAERFPNYARYLPTYGAGAAAIGTIATAIGTIIFINSALDTNGTIDAIHDVGRGPLTIAQIFGQFGGLVLAGAYIIISLHAMRAGLLHRAWGIIGIFAGVMVVLPVAALSQLIQPFFLIVLALILFGRYPGGTPPAWAEGVAIPWPSAAEEARQKREAREGKAPSKPARAARGAIAPPDPDVVEEQAAARPHPSSKKRKRKKRG